VEPEIVDLPHPPVVELNNDLRTAEFLFRAQVEGPETLVFTKDNKVCVKI
jgi:hypothetical protein